MFWDASSFNQLLCWDVSAYVETTSMFEYSQSSIGVATGYYYSGSACLLCAEGTISIGGALADSAACAYCVAGRYSASAGSDTCAVCSAGY